MAALRPYQLVNLINLSTFPPTHFPTFSRPRPGLLPHFSRFFPLLIGEPGRIPGERWEKYAFRSEQGQEEFRRNEPGFTVP
jgi:hypothetical protein